MSCLSAKIRDKDDYINAFVGGSLAGSLFGVVGMEDDLRMLLIIINYHLWLDHLTTFYPIVQLSIIITGCWPYWLFETCVCWVCSK